MNNNKTHHDFHRIDSWNKQCKYFDICDGIFPSYFWLTMTKYIETSRLEISEMQVNN